MDSQAQFEKLVVTAERQISMNHYEAAANAVLQAAWFASEHHPGLYFSAPLEKILLQCAAVLTDHFHVTISDLPGKSQHNIKRNVLHVLTEGYETGGHTRLVSRWCERDTTSVHSVLALEPFCKVTPNWILETTKKTGGWYCSLYDAQVGLCGRAKILRDIANLWADVVVLHSHPFDPIATMAFGIAGGPPVILLNHADHVFWLGVSVADAIVNIRPSGQQITCERRGGSSGNEILSMPLGFLTNTKYTQGEAKCKLGINEDTIVLLSIASAYKYAPSGDFDFGSTMLNIVDKYDNIIVLIVGPADIGQWNKLRNETGNRIRAVGVQNDLEIFHRAADIYLDSFCIGSLTASLEAGLRGIPVVSLSNPINKTLSSDDMSLINSEAVYSDLNSYAKQVGCLIEQVDDRMSVGCNLMQKIKADHIDNWLDSLNKIYRNLPNNHSIVIPDEQISQWNDGDLWWAYLQNKKYQVV